jgi:serine/threonine protein kinase
LARRRDAVEPCDYAVKIVSKSDHKAARTARHEAECHRQLEHPGVCSFVDVLEDEENVYLVLEYIEGHDLFEEIAAKGNLDESYAAEVTRQLLEILEYCHLAKNLIHRDIKPENIMLTVTQCVDFGVADVRVKLIDFGLAQEADYGVAQPGVGTAGYLAPETTFGEYSPASDMWSVGKFVCFMLFGGCQRNCDGVSSEARDFASSPFARGRGETAHIRAGVASPVVGKRFFALAANWDPLTIWVFSQLSD